MKPNKIYISPGKRANLLTAQDIAFIHTVLENEYCGPEEICSMLNDKNLRLKLLDKKTLVQSLIKNKEMLNISNYFYYFLLCRRVMVEAGLNNPAFANNITAFLFWKCTGCIARSWNL